MAKKHLEAGPFGKAVCGKSNVDTESDVRLVTCKVCKRTSIYKSRRAYLRKTRA